MKPSLSARHLRGPRRQDSATKIPQPYSHAEEALHGAPRLSTSVACMLVLLALCATMQGQNYQSGDFTYSVNGDTINIVQYTGTNRVVTIPSTINGLPVTGIGDYAFEFVFSMTSVTIPNSVTNIGDYAFARTGLTVVTIPNSVTSVGEGAFIDNASMTSVTIPNSVTSIGDLAFSDNGGLTAITVDALNLFYSSVNGVLFNKSQTTLIQYPGGNIAASYTIPNGVTSIGDRAFAYCSRLSSVTIPNSVTSIGDLEFYQCAELTAIAVGAGNLFYSSLNGVLFNKGQTTLIQYPQRNVVTSYTIPNSVKSIGDYSFAFSGLTSVTIPDSVTSIGDHAFESCHDLTSVTIGNSVTSIGIAAFYSCGSMTSVAIGNSLTSIANGAFSYCLSLTNVTIPNGLTSIADSAFFNCINLTRVTIPNSVTNIGADAFAFTGLTSVSIPNSITAIVGVFGYCTSLTNVTIPNSVTSIGVDAFSGCSSLTSVTIPNSVTSITDSVFDNCTSLTGVYFLGNAPSSDSTLFYGDQNVTVYYLAGTTGWSSTFGGIPTALWILPYPLILNSSLGVQSNHFGFTVSWATNAFVVVEAATDLKTQNWYPVQTNALNNGVVNFTDPKWANYPSRFYRVRTQIPET